MRASFIQVDIDVKQKKLERLVGGCICSKVQVLASYFENVFLIFHRKESEEKRKAWSVGVVVVPLEAEHSLQEAHHVDRLVDLHL
jgi:hypothetical protein